MTFLTISFFWAGCAAVSIPVLLHFVMKGRPKKELFPAFGFIRQTQRANRRRLILKHWFLLALRSLILILLGLMLARPTLTLFSKQDNETHDSSGKNVSAASVGRRSEGPVAAAIVFDTSVRMDYRRNNFSRLDEAKSFAHSLIPRLPEGSQIAILDSVGSQDSFQIDPLAARERIDRLQAGPSRRSLVESVMAGIRLLRSSEMENREIFILTDRTAAGWPSESRTRLQRLIDDPSENTKGEIDFFLADFSVPDAVDTALTGGIPVVGFTGNGGNVSVDVDLAVTGEGKDGLLDLYLAASGDAEPASKSNQSKESDSVADSEGNTEENVETDSKLNLAELSEEDSAIGPVLPVGMKKRRTESFSIHDGPADANGERHRRVSFRLTDLTPGFYQGFIQMTPSDALVADDRVDFSFVIGTGKRILLVAPEPVEERALFVREALAPETLQAVETPPFDLETVPADDFAQTELDPGSYHAVLFLDTLPPSESEWKRVVDYVQNGGAVGFFPGRCVTTKGFESPNAQTLLGGKPVRQVRAGDDGVFLVPTDPDHPVLSGFRSQRGDVPWQDLPIFRYWRMEWNEGQTPMEILRYSDGNPALVERRVGEGRVILSTTPFSDPPSDAKAWNFLTSGDHAWIFLILADGIAQTLTGGGDRLNLEPFETASLHPTAKKFPESVTMTLPDGRSVPIQTETARRMVRFSGTGAVGSYRFFSALDENGENVTGGFSVREPADHFRLTLITPESLRDYWDPIPLTVIRNPAEMESVRTRRRSGQEIFPVVALLFALLFSVEVIFSNRFYD